MLCQEEQYAGVALGDAIKKILYATEVIIIIVIIIIVVVINTIIIVILLTSSLQEGFEAPTEAVQDEY